jgi:hypothetical protein
MKTRKYFWRNDDFKFVPFQAGKGYCYIYAFQLKNIYETCGECDNEIEIEKDALVMLFGYSYFKRNVPEKKVFCGTEPARTERDLYLWLFGHEFHWRF